MIALLMLSTLFAYIGIDVWYQRKRRAARKEAFLRTLGWACNTREVL